MREGDAVKGLLGWEWHGKPAKDLPGFEILATSEAVDTRDRDYSPHTGTITGCSFLVAHRGEVV